MITRAGGSRATADLCPGQAPLYAGAAALNERLCRGSEALEQPAAMCLEASSRACEDETAASSAAKGTIVLVSLEQLEPGSLQCSDFQRGFEQQFQKF